MTTKAAAPSSNQLGRTLGTGGQWPRRLLLHHLPLALASAVLFVLFMDLTRAGGIPQLDMTGGGILPQEGARMDHGGNTGGRGFMARSTTATGYVATMFLGLTLLIGPANLLLRRRNPVSSYLRRDIGAWTVIGSIVHVVLGFQVHGTGSGQISDIVRYFFLADGTPRTNSFGLGNWTGLAALVIAVVLLALSTDTSLRQLKAKRWKNLQRLNYALFALVVLHAFFYGALLQIASPFGLLLLLTVIAVLAGQAVGIALWRRKRRVTLRPQD